MTRRLAALAVAGALTAAAVAPPARAAALPSFADVRAAHRPSDVVLLDRHGEPLQTLRIDDSVRRLGWVALADISPALLSAVVLGEDRRFHEHAGVDWSAAARSAWANLWNTRTQGASTLTMQLAGLLDAGLARPAGGRGLARKVGQAIGAVQLDAQWRKSEILEAYLNTVPFRGEQVGIGALSHTLFGKRPSGLDQHEAAIAAALLRAPNAPPAAVARRACALLALQRLACDGIAASTEVALARGGGGGGGGNAMAAAEPLAPHFASHLPREALRSAAATSLRSTLDARLQRFAIATLRTQLAELAGRQVEDGALVVLDNASGEVLAWVGSNADTSAAARVDAVLARRQPGSTLKPFVYGLAFERRLLTPATLLDDAPAQLAAGSGLYLPQNYDRGFKGWVSARTALASSLNVPAVRVGALLGADALWARLNAFGLALPESGGYYGASLALGSAEVTLLALTNAYRALANGGVWSPVRTAPGQPVADGRRVASAAATFLVTDILADNTARAMTFGLDNPLATRGFAAVKTGTSKDLRDNWCLGFTDRYTIGVWVGNAGGAPMHDVSGTSGAAPVWAALARQLHAAAPSLPPRPPAGVRAAALRFEGGREAARSEWFAAGTEPTTPLQRAATAPFGIASPRDGSVFALDPDIPPAAQRITFEGERGRWVLDGRPLGHGERLRWAPWPGRHGLVLQGADGRVLQSVTFEVRGAAVRTDRRPAPGPRPGPGTRAPSPRRSPSRTGCRSASRSAPRRSR